MSTLHRHGLMLIHMCGLRQISLKITLGLFIASWGSIAFAKPADQQADNEKEAAITSASNPEDQAIIEEVLVIGQGTPITIRRELFNTQDMIYDMFNTLNKDDAYDMICIKEARIGSQIKYKTCLPRYRREAVSAASEDWRDGMMPVIDQSEMKRRTLRQREIMAELANKNPQFLNLLKKRMALRKAYEATGRKDLPASH